MIDTKKKDITLDRVLCIYYLIYFQKYNINVKTLIYSENKVNIMTLTHILKLSLQDQKINIRASKLINHV